MKNIIKYLLTEEDLISKAGLNINNSVITGVDFDPYSGELMIIFRTSKKLNIL